MASKAQLLWLTYKLKKVAKRRVKHRMHVICPQCLKEQNPNEGSRLLAYCPRCVDGHQLCSLCLGGSFYSKGYYSCLFNEIVDCVVYWFTPEHKFVIRGNVLRVKVKGILTNHMGK